MAEKEEAVAGLQARVRALEGGAGAESRDLHAQLAEAQRALAECAFQATDTPWFLRGLHEAHACCTRLHKSPNVSNPYQHAHASARAWWPRKTHLPVQAAADGGEGG